MTEVLRTQTTTPRKRLTDAEVAEALQVLEEAGQLQAAQLKRRRGRLIPSSVLLISRDREQRSRSL